MIVGFGIKFILASAGLTVISALWAASKDSVVFFITALILALVTIFLTFFYRNPTRSIPGENNLILSIADGRVLSVVDIENEFIGGKGKKVSIFLSVFDVHINRIPIDGKIDYLKYKEGRFFKAFEEEASIQNEQTEIGMTFYSGKMIFKQIAGLLARRIEYSVKENDSVVAGDIYGMIHFGSRAELFLPDNVEVLVKKGDRVKGGSSIIGRIKDN